MLPKLDFKPAEAAAFWQLNLMRITEFEALAEKWLVEDLGGSELSVAAFGLPETRLDADPMVQKVLAELGIAQFSQKQLAWLAIHACHARLLDKRWESYEAAKIIVQIAYDFEETPLFDGKDPHMAHVRVSRSHNRDPDRMFAGEQCRVNGVYWAYYSKDGYHYNWSYNSNEDNVDYKTFVKRVKESVENDILSEAKASWKNYFSLSANLPDEYESLKAFL